MIRILLVDDQKTVRETLKAILKSIPDLNVVGTADNGQAAIAQVEQLYPDIALIDMEMPGLDGVETTKIICQQFPGVRVIILSMHDQDYYVAKAVRAGAMGYLLKNTPAEELEEAIRSVHRGYAQIGPGLLSKIITVTAEPVVTNSEENQESESEQKTTRFPAGGQLQKLGTNQVKLTSANFMKKKRRFYLLVWLVGNIFLWSVSLLYLKFRSPTYTSSWTIALPGTASSTSINLPEIGQASSQNQSPFSSLVSDPRENYKLLATSEDVINPAAKSLMMTPKEFGEPAVEIVDNSTLMEFKIQGSTPKESKAKAIAIYQALQSNLERLKNIESTEPDKITLKTIKNSQLGLAKARQELADYQESSGLNSNAQVEILANSIEQMRIEKAQLNTQQRRTQGKLNKLLNELKLSPQEAQDALSLNSDSLFKQYLDKYSQIKTQLVDIEAQYLPSHPLVIEKQKNSQAAETALLQRASSLLGQATNINTLSQLGLNGDGNQSNSQKENLVGQLIYLQGEQQGLTEQAQELEQQITQLETKQKQRSRSSSKLDQLKKNVQIAEAVYSSTLTQLEINKTNTSNLYPPISLLTQPNLPQEQSVKPQLIFAGSLIASFFLTTALLSLWWRDLRFYAPGFWESNSNHNNHKALSNSNHIIQEIIKK